RRERPAPAPDAHRLGARAARSMRRRRNSLLLQTMGRSHAKGQRQRAGRPRMVRAAEPASGVTAPLPLRAKAPGAPAPKRPGPPPPQREAIDSIITLARLIARQAARDSGK